MEEPTPSVRKVDLDHQIIPNHDSQIFPLSVNWQLSKCLNLRVKTLPWKYEDIGMDGDCLFRCLSIIISGSQEYYSKIRGEICRFIAKDGKEVLALIYKCTYFS